MSVYPRQFVGAQTGEVTSAATPDIDQDCAENSGRLSIRPGLSDNTVHEISSQKPLDSLNRISVDPAVCGGRPCIAGTRIRVSDIVDLLAYGASTDEILQDYPNLVAADITAALFYAARAV